jgi:hypothetical protein
MRKGIWLALSCLLPACGLAVEWQDEWVADYQNLYFKGLWYIDMDYDANGGDHIAWVDFDYDALNESRYLYYTYVPDPRGGGPGQGFTELVARIGPTGVAIAVDRNADPPVPYIMYSDGENPAHVILASRVNGNWTSEIIRTFPFEPGEPREIGDEYAFMITACGLAIGTDETIHAAFTVYFQIVTDNEGKFDCIYDTAYAKKEPVGSWELTNWLGTREVYEPAHRRKKYQQEGADVVLGYEDEPYVSLCEYRYNDSEASYIFLAAPDGVGGWDYEQVEEMDKVGDFWSRTSVVSLGYIQPEALQYPDLNLAYVASVPPAGTRTYYVARIGAMEWVKDLVYEDPNNPFAIDVEVLWGDYGPGVAFGESTYVEPDGFSYASLYARDTAGVWSDILSVEREFLSGNSITAAVKPDGYTDVFYNWGYSETRGANEFDASLLAAYELPELDFASGPPAEASRVPVLTRAFPAPNPAADTLHIKFELSCPGPVKITVYDLAGRKIHTEARAGVAGVNTLSIPVSHWSRGVYIYELTTGDSCKTGKAVIAR